MRHFQKIKINEDKLREKSEHREELESERGHNIVGVPACILSRNKLPPAP